MCAYLQITFLGFVNCPKIFSPPWRGRFLALCTGSINAFFAFCFCSCNICLGTCLGSLKCAYNVMHALRLLSELDSFYVDRELDSF